MAEIEELAKVDTPNPIHWLGLAKLCALASQNQPFRGVLHGSSIRCIGCLGAEPLGKFKVEDLELATFAPVHVGGAHDPVENTAGMGGIECIGNMSGQSDHL
jgi:hypothetical protein